MSEEEHREQQEKLNADMKRLEHFLENFDYFSGRTMHKLKFHGQYLKAREVFYENMVVFPDLKSQDSFGDEVDAAGVSGDGQVEAIENEANPSKPNTSPSNVSGKKSANPEN